VPAATDEAGAPEIANAALVALPTVAPVCEPAAPAAPVPAAAAGLASEVMLLLVTVSTALATSPPVEARNDAPDEPELVLSIAATVPLPLPLPLAPLLQPPSVAPSNDTSINPMKTRTVAAMIYQSPEMSSNERTAGSKQIRTSSRQRIFAFAGNSAICYSQTGSFAPPPRDGFAIASA